jgi:transposase InsO family protein
MSLRLEFVQEALLAADSFRAVCARYGISEKTGYKWRARFLEAGPPGVTDRPHTALRCPHRTPAGLVDALCAARRAHPTWGARKLRAFLLAQQPRKPWPAPSTITGLLAQAGLVTPRRRRPAGAHLRFPRTEAREPNDVWTADFKGEFRTLDRAYCYPLTVQDAASRFLLGCDAERRITEPGTRARFVALFRTFGLPAVLRTDNGVPFASPAIRGLSTLSVWWLRLGISLERIRRGHPEENGAHERFHRTLKAETTRPPAATCRAQQRVFRRFRTEYNDLRPHEALGQSPPAAHYVPSLRPYPERLPALEYPAHFETRLVAANGAFRWHTHGVFLTTVLQHLPIGLEPVADGEWTIHFGALLLGLFSERTNRVIDLNNLPVSPIHPV